MLYYYREEDGDGDEIFGDGVGRRKIVEQAVGKRISKLYPLSRTFLKVGHLFFRHPKTSVSF